jgi:hypothetical protein
VVKFLLSAVGGYYSRAWLFEVISATATVFTLIRALSLMRLWKLRKFHQRQLVDVSDPTYKEHPSEKLRNPINGSWWIRSDPTLGGQQTTRPGET